MISNRIADSAKFLRMPPSTRDLYFYLVLGADDDGVVEAFAIMRKINASEDDLRLLVTKKFVIVLNEELVTYIVDWHEHNLIRADRKIDSIYQTLLLQVVPNADVKRPKPRADTGKPTGRPVDNQWTAQDKLRQDNTIQDKLSKPVVVVSSTDPPKIYEEIFEEVPKGYTLEVINKYTDKLGVDLFTRACIGAGDKGKGFGYATGIMDNWLKKGLLTNEAIDKSEAEFKRRQEAKHNAVKPNKTNGQIKETLPDWAKPGYKPPKRNTPLTPEQEAKWQANIDKLKS